MEPIEILLNSFGCGGLNTKHFKGGMDAIMGQMTNKDALETIDNTYPIKTVKGQMLFRKAQKYLTQDEQAAKDILSKLASQCILIRRTEK